MKNSPTRNLTHFSSPQICESMDSTFENTGISEEFTNYQKSLKIEEIFYKILEIVFFRLFDIERKAGIFRG